MLIILWKYSMLGCGLVEIMCPKIYYQFTIEDPVTQFGLESKIKLQHHS